jgi:predicted ATPase/DNA-binding NarL/FixJ family response regulator
LSTFIGREREIATVEQLLTKTRLLTLTGAAGIGKTRLALQVATQLWRQTSSHILFVELAAVTDPNQLAQTVASDLGLNEQPDQSSVYAVIEALQRGSTVLVVDNCEHVIQASAMLADVLLRECGELRILATSREPLHLAGEIVWPVPPLPLPAPHTQQSLSHIAESAAVRLFVDRARANMPEFTLDERSAAATAQVCSRLDGIPLAIELAAARISVLSVQQIAERVDDALSLLSKVPRNSPEGRQTLRATIDWSYNLLSEAEQRLFKRLSVFSGGWRLEAAEAVCADATTKPTEVLDVLDGLTAKSLVQCEPQVHGVYRFRLLETLRQYAREKLITQGEQSQLRQRHAEFFLGLAERVQPELLGHGAPVALDRLEEEHDNLRASLQWLLDRSDTERAQRLAGALGRFWQLRCHFAEGQMWVTRALALSTAQQRTCDRARCLHILGNLMSGRGDLVAADEASREALSIWRDLGNIADQAWTLYTLGQNAWRRGDYVQAKDLLKESVAISRTTRLVQAEANAVSRLADIALDLGEYAEAEHLADQTLALATAAGWAPATALAQRILGEVCVARGESEGAPQRFEASLASARELGNGLIIAQALFCIAEQAIDRNDLAHARECLSEGLELAGDVHDHAAIAKGLEAFGALAIAAVQTNAGVELVGAARALRHTARAHMPRREQRRLERSLARARSVLGTQGLERALRAGGQMTIGRSIERALKLSIPVADRAPDNLTPREQEVAALVGKGLTNPQIARELVIGTRTVQTHVGNILAKLGLDSRVQLAAWVIEHRLALNPTSASGNP